MTATDRPATDQGLTLAEAATQLGISAEAVRSRLRRGTLAGVQTDGHWRVFLGGQPTDQQPTADRPDDRPSDRATGSEDAALIARLMDETAWLRAQLEDALSQLAVERERSDTLQRIALDRIEALTAGEQAPASEEPSQNAPRATEWPSGATHAEDLIGHLRLLLRPRKRIEHRGGSA